MSLQGKGQVLYFFILFANRNQSLPLLLDFYRAAFYSTSYNWVCSNNWCKTNIWCELNIDLLTYWLFYWTWSNMELRYTDMLLCQVFDISSEIFTRPSIPSKPSLILETKNHTSILSYCCDQVTANNRAQIFFQTSVPVLSMLCSIQSFISVHSLPIILLPFSRIVSSLSSNPHLICSLLFWRKS